MTKDRSPRSTEKESDRAARLLVEPFLKVIDSAWPKTRIPDRVRARCDMRRQMVRDLLSGRPWDSFVSKLLLIPRGGHPLYRSVAEYRRNHSPHEHGSLTDRELRIVAIEVLGKILNLDEAERLVHHYARQGGVSNSIELLEVATFIGTRLHDNSKLAGVMLGETRLVLSESYGKLDKYVCDTAQSMMAYALLCLNPLAILSAIVTLCPDNITDQMISYGSSSLSSEKKPLWNNTIEVAQQNRDRLFLDVDAWNTLRPDDFHSWVVQSQLIEALQGIAQLHHLPPPELPPEFINVFTSFSTATPWLMEIRRIITVLSGTSIVTQDGVSGVQHESSLVKNDQLKSQLIKEIVQLIRSARNPEEGAQGMYPTPSPSQLTDLAWLGWGFIANLKKRDVLTLEEKTLLEDVLKKLWQAHDDSGNGFLRGLPLPNPAIKVARLGVDKEIEIGVDNYYKNLKRIVEVHCIYTTDQCNKQAVKQLVDEVMRRVTRHNSWGKSELSNMHNLLNSCFQAIQTWHTAPLDSIQPIESENCRTKLTTLTSVLNYFDKNRFLVQVLDATSLKEKEDENFYSNKIRTGLRDIQRILDRIDEAVQTTTASKRGVRTATTP